MKADSSSSENRGVALLLQQRQLSPSHLKNFPLDFFHPGPVNRLLPTLSGSPLSSLMTMQNYSLFGISQVLATFSCLISVLPLHSNHMDHNHLLQFCYFLLTPILCYWHNDKIFASVFFILTFIFSNLSHHSVVTFCMHQRHCC